MKTKEIVSNINIKLYIALIITIIFLSGTHTVCGAAINTSAQAVTAGQTQNNDFITISAAGDCTLGNNDNPDANGSFIDVFNRENKNYDYFFQNVKPVFDKDDLTVVNLETTLTNATLKMDKEYTFKGYPEFTNVLFRGGIDAVNISNNHIHDYFQIGFEDTVNNLKAAGLGFFGEGYSYIKVIKGVKIGFLGYRAWEKSSYLKNIIKRDIKKLREGGCSIVITSFHWGEEMKNYPNDIQTEFGRFAIDNGSDLVLGHHPHVIQGIEKYKGKYIVYSLGNFSFGGSRNPKDKDTFIFQMKFGVKDGRLTSNNLAAVIPCSISSTKTRNDFKPTLLSGKDKQNVIIRLNNYSSSFKTKINNLGIIN